MTVQIAVRLFNRVDGGKRSFVVSGARKGDFLADLLVDVVDVPGGATGARAPGKPVRKIGSKGAATFDLPSGSRVCDLKIEFRPTTDRPPPVFIQQRIAISANGSLSPLEPPKGAMRIWIDNGDLHPRLVLEKKTIWVDVTFLDMTKKAKRKGAGSHNVERRLYEYTAGTPAVWVISIPPLKWPFDAKRSPVGFVVFFRPALKTKYSNADDLDMKSIERYLDGPRKPKSPWFIDPEGFPFQGQKLPAMDAFPNCDFERQIAEGATEKSRHVVLAMPVPLGAEFGDAMSPRLPGLLDSLLRAIWSSVPSFPVEGSRFELSKFAIAGFSRGGPAAFAAFNANESRVNDLYLFDTEDFGAMTKKLETWIQAGSDRKLRLIGGRRLDEMLGFEKTLRKLKVPSTNEFTVWPTSSTFWDSKEWVALLKTGDPADELTSVPIGVVPTYLSELSGIFLAGKAKNGPGVRLEAHDNDAKSIGQADVGCTADEATFQVRFFTGPAIDWRVAPFARVKDAKDHARWRDLPATLRARSLGTRHQWAVIGGTGSMDRGAGFSGYLKMCIDRSKFE